MITFEFARPVDVTEFTNTVLKKLDVVIPDITIQLPLMSNTFVTGMSVWVSDSEEMREKLREVLIECGIEVNN